MNAKKIGVIVVAVFITAVVILGYFCWNPLAVTRYKQDETRAFQGIPWLANYPSISDLCGPSIIVKITNNRPEVNEEVQLTIVQNGLKRTDSIVATYSDRTFFAINPNRCDKENCIGTWAETTIPTNYCIQTISYFSLIPREAGVKTITIHTDTKSIPFSIEVVNPDPNDCPNCSPKDKLRNIADQEKLHWEYKLEADNDGNFSNLIIIRRGDISQDLKVTLEVPKSILFENNFKECNQSTCIVTKYFLQQNVDDLQDWLNTNNVPFDARQFGQTFRLSLATGNHGVYHAVVRIYSIFDPNHPVLLAEQELHIPLE